MSKWEMVKLGDVFHTIRNGASIKQGVVDGGIPITRIETIFDGNINRNKMGYAGIKDNKYENYFLQDGDILMSHINSEKHLGKIALYNKENDEDIIHGMNLLCLKTNSNSSKYFLYALRSNYFRNQLPCITKKSVNQASFTVTALKDLKIPLPPLEIQDKIAKNLDLASDLVNLHKTKLEELDKLIQSVFYDMFGDPVTNEKGWSIEKLGDVITINPKKIEIKLHDEDIISFVPMQLVSESGRINTSCHKKYKEVKKGFTYFYENDVLFAKITPCMENRKGTIACGLKNYIGFGSTEFHVLRPKGNITNSEWLFRLTHSENFRLESAKNMTGSAGQKRVPADYLKNLITPIPPLPLQQKFANIVTEIEKQKSQVQKALDDAQMLYNSLMQEYFE